MNFYELVMNRIKTWEVQINSPELMKLSLMNVN